MRTIRARGLLIDVVFPYEAQIVEAIKQVPGRRFVKNPTRWLVPSTSWHAKKTIEVLSPWAFDIDPVVQQLADGAKQDFSKSFSPLQKDGFTGLYPYQRDAVDFIQATGGRCILGDEMGLGKTIEALAWIDMHPAITHTLIVCPASVIYKWQEECGRWAGNDAKVVLTSAEPLPQSRFHIMSYAIMTRRYTDLMELYDCLILDESHAIKSYKAQRTRAAKVIAERTRHLLLLSGTPFLNRPIELFTGLNMIEPRAWPSAYSFGNRYCGGLTERGLYQGATNTAELADRLKTVMVRRLKADVLAQLPALRRTILPVDISNFPTYTEVRAQVRSAITALDPSHKGYFVGALDQLNLLRRCVGLGKVAAAVELAENILEQIDGKVVIYCHHLEVLQNVHNGLVGQGTASLHGGTSIRDRGDALARFRNPGGPRVLLLTSAGGEGIDLFGLGGVDVSRLIFVEMEWTPAAMAQIEGRLHRIGQTNAVESYWLSARKTIDGKMSKMLSDKQTVLDSVLGQQMMIREVLGEL